ncbi:MAG: uroporphyrinogen-III synthase [Planctomycetaceae bacterium]|nr:uroporphyrinogen-III synthase [Planctomycetaceae bacterium]
MPFRVCSLESRRAGEMKSLLERHGAAATVAPSMREIPLEENVAALDFAAALLAGRIDVVVFMTGVGAKALLEAVETQYSREEFLAALRQCVVAVRGPKPQVVLREWKVAIDVQAPAPNTWHELLAAMTAAVPCLAGKTVAVQEYGESSEEFYGQLRELEANVLPVPVYRWAFPEDTGPLEAAVQAMVAGEFDALIITSAQQLTHLLMAAESLGLKERFLAAARDCVIGSIGPTATERIQAEGLKVDVEASPPKMGVLAREICRQGPAIRTARVK